MFEYAYELLLEKGDYKKSDILMVGDTLHTDIIGGNKFGIDTVLVMTGNTRMEWANILMESYGIVPDFVSESIGK